MDHKIFDEVKNGDKFHVRSKKDMLRVVASFYYWKKTLPKGSPLRERVVMQMSNADNTFFVFVFDNKSARDELRRRVYGPREVELIRAS